MKKGSKSHANCLAGEPPPCMYAGDEENQLR